MTLSPIEIAKAFDAGLLKDANSNATAREIIEELGSRRIRYGVVRNQKLTDGPPKIGDAVQDFETSSAVEVTEDQRGTAM